MNYRRGLTLENENAEVLVESGNNKVKITGSEDFISENLEEVLGRLTQSETETTTIESTDEKAVDSEEEDSLIKKLSKAQNLNPEKMSNLFYVDEETEEIHIDDPQKIPPKYALAGYCALRETLTGETKVPNSETKNILIDREKMEIDEWGSKFLYTLRKSGWIKDASSDKSRNKPFKLTPKGLRNLREWLDEDS